MENEISVSKEYIDTVCDWIEEWAEHEDSWIIPQFLKKHGIGWSYFQAMVNKWPQLRNSFEKTIAGLCAKWFVYGMTKKDMPQHMQKILMKYLRVYDNHAYYVDHEAKKALANNTYSTPGNYAVENYSEERLEGFFKRIYDDNVNKRRNRTSPK